MVLGVVIAAVILIISIVIGVSVFISYTNDQKLKKYDGYLQTLSAKANKANQYGYEENQIQENSLNKVRGEMMTNHSKMLQINKDVDYIQKNQGVELSNLEKKFSNIQSDLSKNVSDINTINSEQTSKLDGMSMVSGEIQQQIKFSNDQLTVINGQFVNISQKQQSDIDTLTKNMNILSNEQIDLRKAATSIQDDNISKIKDQSKTLTDFQTNVTNSLNDIQNLQKKTEKKIGDRTYFLQNNAGNMNTSLDTLKVGMSNYVTKTDLLPYSTKKELDAANARFGNYLSTKDFTNFKTNLPEFPTKVEMESLGNTYATKDDILAFNNTLSVAKETVATVNGLIKTVQDTYATKIELAAVSNQANTGLLNINSLTQAMDVVKANLETLQESINRNLNAVTAYKTEFGNTYSSKSELAKLNEILTAQIETVKQSSAIVNCIVSDWGFWSVCSKNCGGGTQTRTRKVIEPALNGGSACPSLAETQTCNNQVCPVDCKVTDWSAWTTCSKPCGGGTQTQTRTVTELPSNGGAACPILSQTQTCNPQGCPVDCQVGAWSGWGTCSKPCGGGTQTQTRQITVQPQNGGGACPVLSQSQACNTQICPVDCKVSEWGAFSTCSASCGGGSQIRYRSIIQYPQGGGAACQNVSESQTCNTQPCYTYAVPRPGICGYSMNPTWNSPNPIGWHWAVKDGTLQIKICDNDATNKAIPNYNPSWWIVTGGGTLGNKQPGNPGVTVPNVTWYGNHHNYSNPDPKSSSYTVTIACANSAGTQTISFQYVGV